MKNRWGERASRWQQWMESPDRDQMECTRCKRVTWWKLVAVLQPIEGVRSASQWRCLECKPKG